MVDNNNDDFLILWRIENFNAVAALSNYDIWTPPIPTRKLFDSDFFLLICPLNSEVNYISIYLQQCGNDQRFANSSLDVEFCLIDKNGVEQFNQKCADCEVSKKFVCCVMTFLCADKLLESKGEFIPNGVLTLVCRIQKSSSRGGFSRMSSHVCTDILVERSAFSWSIKDPNLDLVKRIIYFESDFVESGFVVKCESLNICNGDENKNLLNLVIRPKSLPPKKTTMSATIQAICRHKNTVSKVEGIYAFEDGKDAWYLESLDISTFTRNNQELDLMCEFSVSNGNFQSHVEEILFYPAKLQSDVITLKEDISTLFNNIQWKFPSNSMVVTSGGITDIILTTIDYPKGLPVHKMILAARSPLLNNILCNYDMEKKNWLHTTGGRQPIIECKVTAGNNRFKVFMHQGLDVAFISDLSLTTLFQMMYCMYKDILEIQNINNAIELYRVGIYFQFNILKSRCRDYLRSKVSLSIIGDLLPFAYEVGDEWIKQDFLNYINKNRNSVFLSKEWANLCAKFTHMEKVLTDLSNYEIFS